MTEKQAAPPSAGTFTKDELLAHPEAFEVSRAVLAGALHDMTAPITKAQAKAKVTAFTKKEYGVTKKEDKK